MSCRPMIFTDLDGTLLDHYSYDFSPAQPMLSWLAEQNIPVIPATSKTLAELLVWRSRLSSQGPFMVENGAAIYLPKTADCAPPDGLIEKDGFWVQEFVATRQTWIDLVEQLRPQFNGCFRSFTELGIAGIAQLTGLTDESANLASQRQYGEPVAWQGSDRDKQRFIDQVNAAGGQVLQGGRFLHISGNCNKGDAMNWLVAEYRRHWSPDTTLTTIAAGDSGNDRDMLERADIALIIPSPVHEPLSLQRQSGILRATTPGPTGWAEGIKQIMADLTGDTRPATATPLRNQHG